jgi:hypothetical protein
MSSSNGTDATPSPSASQSPQSPVSQSPASAGSWITHALSATLSGFAAFKIAAVLPALSERCDWKTLGLALLALAIVAFPTSLASFGPLVKEVLPTILRRKE